MRILIAEDSRTQATLMKLALTRMGHEVILARDGIEAVRLVWQKCPDLVVSDVVMPRLNGYQVCRLLRDDVSSAQTPVVLLTSLDQRQDAFWGLKSGADKFITKVADIPALVGQIHEFALEQARRARSAAPREEEVCRADRDADVMERVVQLLDRNLFESTVAAAIQDLVNRLDDLRGTVFGLLEILKQVVDFHVGVVHLGGDESQGLFTLANKPVSRDFIQLMREQVLRESGQGPPAEGEEGEVVDPGRCLEQPGEHPAIPQSVLIARLATKGQPSGAIALAAAEANAYPDRVERTFDMIARQANIVLDYARLYENTKRLSITDGLTKLYNHRYFQDSLKREYARTDRQGNPLSLVLLDIDHFKSFNDTYGHQQGDLVLQELSRILRAQVRSLDIVARYGGEEFAVIMPDTAEDVALRVAERLRAAVATAPVPGPTGPLQVTISLGVSGAPRPEITSPAGLIAAADRALYRAKERGRNRVESGA